MVKMFEYGSFKKSEDGNHVEVDADIPTVGLTHVGVSKEPEASWEDQALLLGCSVKIERDCVERLYDAICPDGWDNMMFDQIVAKAKENAAEAKASAGRLKSMFAGELQTITDIDAQHKKELADEKEKVRLLAGKACATVQEARETAELADRALEKCVIERDAARKALDDIGQRCARGDVLVPSVIGPIARSGLQK